MPELLNTYSTTRGLRTNFIYSFWAYFIFCCFSVTLPAQDIQHSNCECDYKLKASIPECLVKGQEYELEIAISKIANFGSEEQGRLVLRNAEGLVYLDEDLHLDDNLKVFTMQFPSAEFESFEVEFFCNSSISCSQTYQIASKPYLVQIENEDVSCYGLSDGSISIIADEDVITTWVDGYQGKNRTGLNGGEYILEISYPNGCISTETITIKEPKPLLLSFREQAIECNGEINNFLYVLAEGGTGMYSYDWHHDGTDDWNDTSVQPSMVSDLFAATVRDENGCTSSLAYNALFDQVSPWYANDAVVPAFEVTSTGEAKFNLPEASNLLNGDVDNNGADGAFMEMSFHLTEQEAEMKENPLPDTVTMPYGTIVFSRVESFNECSDIAQLELIENTNLLTTLDLDITNDRVCFQDDIFQLLNDEPLTPGGFYRIKQCLDGCNAIGNPISQVTNEMGQIEWYWDPDTSNAGIWLLEYCITVGSVTTCGKFDFFHVDEADTEFFVDNTDPCLGGEPVEIISTNNISLSGEGIFYNTNEDKYYFDPTQFNLAAGIYTIRNTAIHVVFDVDNSTIPPTFTEINRCTNTFDLDLQVHASPNVAISANASPICAGAELILSVGAGNEPGATYYWETPSGSETLDVFKYSKKNMGPLDVGKYAVTVTSANLCQDSASVFVMVNELPNIQCNIGNVIMCPGGSNGSATVTIPPEDLDKGPFMYAWSGSGSDGSSYFSNEPVATGLKEGMYMVTVTDKNNCETVCSIELNDPDVLKISINIKAGVDCNGNSTAAANASATGGYGGYMYKWSNGSTTDSVSELGAGKHYVTVTDKEGCTEIDSVEILEPPPLSCSVVITAPSCPNEMNGMATVTGSGGTPEYTYKWSTGATTASISGLAAGDYHVTVTDKNGCFSICSVTLSDPESPYAGEDALSVVCNASAPASVDIFEMLEKFPDKVPDPNGKWQLVTWPGDILHSDKVVLLDALNAYVPGSKSLAVSFMCLPAGMYEFVYLVEEIRVNMVEPCIDTAHLSVQVIDCFDLALKKTVQNVDYEPGDDVRFQIDVFNQGIVNAFNLIVADYIQKGFIYYESKNTAAQTGNAFDWGPQKGDTITIPLNPIEAKASASISVILTIDPAFEGYELENFAEIIYYSNGVKPLPPDEDDKEFYPQESDDDVRDDSNGSIDNPIDDDQFDGAKVFLCNVQVLVCNKRVQISLEENCEIEIDTDMILEGGPYPCASEFDVNIEGLENHIITRPGKYSVTITSNSDPPNSCWGMIEVEDKIPPELMCMDQYIPCTNDTKPGSPILKRVVNKGYTEAPAMLDAEITGGNDSTATWYFEFNMNPIPVVRDIELDLHLDHAAIDELEALLISPDQDTLKLFSNLQKGNQDPNCLKTGLVLSLDDKSIKEYQALQSDPNTCLPLHDPSIMGVYQPEESFSIFRDSLANGIWSLHIIDHNPDSHHGQIDSAQFWLTLSQDSIKFPVVDPNAVFAEIGENEYSISGLGSCDAAYARYSDKITEECAERSISIIERTWIVADSSGNESTCIQLLYIEKGDLNLIQWPRNFDDFDWPAYRCTDEFDLIIPENGMPSPEVTGYPYQLPTPGHSNCNNIGFTFEDVIIPICGNSYKLVRRWQGIDWCIGSESEVFHDQIIKVVDDLVPICRSVVPDFTEVTVSDQYDCLASYTVPAPDVIYECNHYKWSIEYKVGEDTGNDGNCAIPDDETLFITDNISYSNGLNFIEGNDSASTVTIHELPLGCVWIRYVIEDDCGNISTSCTIEIKVVDKTPPTAICDEHTVVVLGPDGSGKIFAESLDDLSWDDCALDSFAIRKVKPEEDCFGTYGTFQPFIEFCCEEVGDSIPVELLVVDKADNSSICMAWIRLDDKIPPSIQHCPDDITLDCKLDYLDINLTGRAYAVDNCEVDSLWFADNISINQCGEGTVYRRWFAMDKGGLTSQCFQTITLKESNAFEMQSDDWPADFEIEGCKKDSDPSITGEPDLDHGNNCSLVAASYEDTEFPIVQDACEKILRTWTVIDWCQYKEGGTKGIWEETQIIILKNTQGPEFTDQCNNLTICKTGPDCQEWIDIPGQALDDCTPDSLLRWHWKIYPFGQGFPDEPIYEGHSGNAGGYYPNGDYTISWVVEDQCGNISVCDQKLSIIDCKEPVPVCITYLTTVIMPSNGQVQIWAEDFDHGSSDNCTSQDELIYSFSSSTSDRYRNFDCLDIKDGRSQQISLEMWITDASGNQDYCDVELALQDNSGNICQDTVETLANISGYVRTEDGRNLQHTAVQLTSANSAFSSMFTTQEDGGFKFSNLSPGDNYRLTSFKSDAAVKGVSTLDLVLIQQHILGLKNLDSPYKILAADADNNDRISASDLLQLRKLILGISNELPLGQKVWQFVDGSQLTGIEDAFAMDESILLDNLVRDIAGLSFMAIKTGDVNGSVQIPGYNQVEIRNHQVLELLVKERLVNDHYLEILFSSSNFEDITGFQFTIEFDPHQLKYEGFEHGLLFVDHSNFGFQNLEEGKISVSWNDVSGQSATADAQLFVLQFSKQADHQLNPALALTSSITKAEAYREDHSILDMELSYAEGPTSLRQDVFLKQNVPNPFNQGTQIEFSVPNEMHAKFTVFDLMGRVIYRKEDLYSKGSHLIDIGPGDLKGYGTLYYRLEAGEFTATRKMIYLK